MQIKGDRIAGPYCFYISVKESICFISREMNTTKGANQILSHQAKIRCDRLVHQAKSKINDFSLFIPYGCKGIHPSTGGIKYNLQAAIKVLFLLLLLFECA